MSAGSPSLPNPPKPAVKSLICLQCGAPITLRALGQASSVVCDSCHAIMDARDSNLQILQTFDKIVSDDRPLIPLGTRGKIRGTDYEVVGYQRRSIVVEGVRYSWHEYVLFNPYKGFRYLTEYQGHWNDISVCKELPTLATTTSVLNVNYLGEYYKHFQTAEATTDFVLGEFPWQVSVGERASVTEYIHPPRVLAMEKTPGEATWSIGEYLEGADVWKAFRLPGSPPQAIGVYENQPSPVNANVKAFWQAFALLAIGLAVIMIFFRINSGNDLAFTSTYRSDRAGVLNEASFVTDPFELTGRTSNVEVTTSADVDNNWIYLNYALIDEDTGQAWDFGREVSYYHGYDSDGSWTEGSRKDSVVVPTVPPGHYYLRIEPEVDRSKPEVAYTVEVHRDVPVDSFYGIALALLLIPPAVFSWRALTFERSRWAESDHPPADIVAKLTNREDE